MFVNVTQQDIDAGVPSDPWACPIAHAIKRRLRPEIPVLVNGDDVVIGFTGLEDVDVYWLPAEARDFLKRFDDHQDVEPFEFEMEAVGRYDDED